VEGVPLACPFSAYPEIVSRFSGRILSWVTYSPLIDILKELTNQKPGTPIMEQGTVSGCVLDLSRLFGCRKVMLVGQDMCVRSDGKYYTNDSAYSDVGSHYTSKLEGHKLPGNTLDEVIVEGRLFVYLKTFEKFISENEEIDYRNLASTGVKVKGAPYIDYNEAIRWIGPNCSSLPFQAKVSELLANQPPCPDLTPIFRPIRKYLKNLLSECLSLSIKSEMLPEKYSGTNYSQNRVVKDILKGSDKVNRIVDSDERLWQLLLDGKTKSELAVYKRIARDINFPNENWSILQKNKEYFWALAEGCNWLLSILDKEIPESTGSFKV